MFWYEDEEEFDAIAGSLRQKTVYIFGGGEGGGGGGGGEAPAPAPAATAAAAAKAEAAAAELAGVPFDACFYGHAGDDGSDGGTSGCGPALAALWHPGRSGPPFFLRPRRRPALDALGRAEGAERAGAGAAAGAAAAADSAWAEIASQNWRLELAYGLGAGGGGSAAGSSRGGAGALLDPERPETVLVVVAPPSAARALAGAALGGGVPPADRLYSVVTLREWEGGGDGAEDAAAPGWRDLLES